MIFVVDSGSTKTDWIALNDNGDALFSTQTLGLNPQVLPSAILTERIINNYDIYLHNVFIRRNLWQNLIQRNQQA